MIICLNTLIPSFQPQPFEYKYIHHNKHIIKGSKNRNRIISILNYFKGNVYVTLGGLVLCVLNSFISSDHGATFINISIPGIASAVQRK